MDESMQPMRASDYAPIKPLDSEPIGAQYRRVTREQREEALRDALRGIELGSYDERIVAWMLRMFDDGTLRTIVSLLERTRAAGMVDLLDIEAKRQKMHNQRAD